MFLVHPGCCHRTPQIGWLIHTLVVLEAGESKVKVPDLGCGEGPVTGSQCLLTVPSRGGRSEGAL